MGSHSTQFPGPMACSHAHLPTTVHLSRPAKAPERVGRLHNRCCNSSNGSSSSSANACRAVRCQATSDSAALPDFGPQRPPPAADDKKGSGSWGSGWSKRSSSGSVFKKQQTKQDTGSSGPGQQPAAAEQLDPQLEASIRMNVDRANQTLQEIVQEVLGELLVEEASAYVLGQEEGEEAADLQLRQAVRGAVVKRLEWLDSNFLAAVNAFVTVPGARSNPELSALLWAVREETLQLVSARLPPPVQVLNATLGHSRREQRGAVMEAALGGGRGDVPGTSLDALGAAAHQLIDDMEDQQVVADRVLLARLVLVREELRALAERQSAKQFWQPEDGSGQQQQQDSTTPAAAAAGPGPAAAAAGDSSSSSQPFFAFHRSNLPARCAAFLKNLLTVPERNKRLGLLTKTFQEDWIAESNPAPSPAAAAAGSEEAAEQPTSYSQWRAANRDTNFGQAGSQQQQQQQQEAPDIVRPGRLLTTLHAMRQELEVQLVSSGVDSPAGAEALTLLRLLEDIRIEALVALDRVQHSRPGSSSSSSSSTSDLLDYEFELEQHLAALQGLQAQ